MNRERNSIYLLQLAASGLFLGFLAIIYVLSNEIQQKAMSETMTSVSNGVTWVEYYPEWFFQLLYILVIATLTGMILTTELHLDFPFSRSRLTTEHGGTNVMNFKELIKDIAEYGGLAFIIYYMVSAIFVMAWSKNILEGIQLFPGLYYSHAYPILIWGSIYLAFYPKLRWKSIFVFFIANAVSGEIFNWGYNLVHGDLFWDIGEGWTYWFRVAMDFVTLGISLAVLRPRLSRKVWTFYVPLGVLFANYALVISWGYPATIFTTGQYFSIPLNVTDLVGLVCWPVFWFGSVKP